MAQRRSKNLNLLARKFQPFRKKVVFALERGLDMLVDGLVARAPRGKTLKLLGSIRKTKIVNDHRRHRLYGRAIVGVRYAVYVNYGTKYVRARRFVQETQAVVGPLAVQAVRLLLK